LDLTVTTCCHPPYLKYLREHLTSLKRALKMRDVPIILLNTLMKEKDISKANEIIAQVNLPNLQVVNTEDYLLIGQIRNRLFDLSKSEWTLFTEVDTILVEEYFDELEKFFARYDLTNVSAIGGGIGLVSASRFGKYEGLMELVAFVGKIGGLDKAVFESLFNGDDLPIYAANNERCFWDAVRSSLAKYEGREIRYLQGYNQIIHNRVKTQFGGFDNKLGAAEERDVAANILCRGGKILFAPRSTTLHRYDFDLDRIMRRKKFHGRWAQRFRDKYRHRPDVVKQYDLAYWFKFAFSLFKPPAPFDQSYESRWYYLTTSLTYMLASIGEGLRFRLSSASDSGVDIERSRKEQRLMSREM